jgi:hypothetical protein
MSKSLPMLAAMAIVALATAARAADDTPAGDAPVKTGFMKGFIIKVDGASLIFKDKSGPEVTVATTDSTKVTIDGKAATLADLKEGYFVQVTSADDKADKIIASTKRRKP